VGLVAGTDINNLASSRSAGLQIVRGAVPVSELVAARSLVSSGLVQTKLFQGVWGLSGQVRVGMGCLDLCK
jgi:hypothetical protein